MAVYWIGESQISNSVNQMYRSYIYNFQEDMWNKIYKSRSYETPNQCDACIKFNEILEENYNRFQQHLDQPANAQLILQHVNWIDTALHELLDEFGDDTSNIFYKAVQEIHNEFGM